MELFVEPDRVQAGDVVRLFLGDADAQVWTGGLYAEIEYQQGDGWTPLLHLTGIPVGGDADFPPAIPSNEPRFERAVGVRGPIRFQIPKVPAGKYRLSRRYVRPGPEKVTLHVDLLVTEGPT